MANNFKYVRPLTIAEKTDYVKRILVVWAIASGVAFGPDIVFDLETEYHAREYMDLKRAGQPNASNEYFTCIKDSASSHFGAVATYKKWAGRLSFLPETAARYDHDAKIFALRGIVTSTMCAIQEEQASPPEMKFPNI